METWFFRATFRPSRKSKGNKEITKLKRREEILNEHCKAAAAAAGNNRWVLIAVLIEREYRLINVLKYIY